MSDARLLQLTAATILAATMFSNSPAEERDSPPNTWVKAEIDFDATLKNYLGDHEVRWMQTDGYCDSVHLPTRGGVLIRTGIHFDELGLSPGFYSNTSVLWDLKTDTAKVVEVANWSGGSYGSGRLLPAYAEHKTPSPRHTYDGICYVPDEDRVYMLLGAYGRMRSKEPSDEAIAELNKDGERTWAFSFKTNRWECIEDSVWKLFKTSPYENHLVHWPEGGKLLFLNDNGDKYAQFDLKSHKWAAVQLANKCPFRLYNARSTWDGKRSLWVFRLGPRLCTFNPKTSTFAELPNCYDMNIPTADEVKAMKAEGMQPDARLHSKGVCYVSRHDRYLVCGPTGNDTAVYDPEKKTWTAIKGGDLELVNGYMQYDETQDIAVMNYQLKCFKFKYMP